MIATDVAPSPQAAPPAVAMFSSRMLGWLAVLLGIPTGLILIAHNWWQLGRRGRAVAYLGGAVFSLLVIAFLLAGPLGKLSRPLLGILYVVALVIVVAYGPQAEDTASSLDIPLVYRDAIPGIAVGAVVVLALALGTRLFPWLLAAEPRVVALDAADGRARWAVALGDPTEAGPSFMTSGGGRTFVYTSGRPNSPGYYRKDVTALDSATERQLWRISLDPLNEDLDPHQGSFRERKLFADGDTLYLQLWDGTDSLMLQAIDATSGASRWVAGLPSEGPFKRQYARIAPWGDALAMWDSETTGRGASATTTYFLKVLDRRTGTMIRRIDLPDVDPNTPLDGPFVVDGLLIADLGGGRLAAFAPGTGERRWSTSVSQTLWLGVSGTALYGQRTGPTTTSSRELVAIDAATGQLRWSYPFTAYLASDRHILGSDGAYIVNTARDEARRCDITSLVAVGADGRERWRVEAAPLSLTGPVLTSETVVGNVWSQPCAGPASSGLVAFARADGSERWRQPGSGLDVLSAADGQISLLQRAPRWRNWLARVNIAWR